MLEDIDETLLTHYDNDIIVRAIQSTETHAEVEPPAFCGVMERGPMTLEGNLRPLAWGKVSCMGLYLP